MSEFDDKLEAACNEAVRIATLMLDSERAAHAATRKRMRDAEEALREVHESEYPYAIVRGYFAAYPDPVKED